MAADTPRLRRGRDPLRTVPNGHESSSTSPKKRKRRRHTKRRTEEPPFYILVIQVGAVLATLCFITYKCYRAVVPVVDLPVTDDVDDDDDILVLPPPKEPIQPKAGYKPPSEESALLLLPEDPVKRVPVPLPTFNVTDRADDPFLWNISDSTLFGRAARGLLDQFAELYGGENAARALIENSLTAVNASIEATACRLQQARDQQRPFRIMFGGYSVTVGRGNYFSQSYPLVFQRKLQTLFSLLGLQLHVENAAIGGCPSFPYGWCMNAFFGNEPDMVSWDFSMNEAGGEPSGLEAWIRQLLARPHAPKLLVKDTSMATERQQLIQNYSSLLRDPIVLHLQADAFLALPEVDRPVGFQEWRKFGAPLGAPGQQVHHPAKKEHELFAWLLVMHLLPSLLLIAQDTPLSCESSPVRLPEPIHSDNATWSSMLFGQADEAKHWHMNRISCRTSFEPIVQDDLSDLVVSGASEAVKLMLPKSNMFYNQGWVLDLSDSERSMKQRLDRYELGFRDVKKAYYGLYSSGILSMLLPVNTTLAHPRDVAAKWVSSVVVCEVNEKRETGDCHIAEDVHFLIGGVNATAVPMTAGGTLFLGKKICVYLEVPPAATLTTRARILSNQATESPIKQHHVRILHEEQRNTTQDETEVGLSLELKVKNQHIMKTSQACSVSHVVWEEQQASTAKAETS